MSLDEFLVKDYEFKANFLTSEYQRMWTRFNFFVTIESALVGGKFVIGRGDITPGFVLVGTVLSLVWYVFGAQDRYLVRIYEKHVNKAAESLSQSMKLPNSELAIVADTWVPVSEKSETIGQLKEEDKQASRWKQVLSLDWLSGWRSDHFSITRLAALFPLLIFFCWITLMAYTIFGAESAPCPDRPEPAKTTARPPTHLQMSGVVHVNTQ